MEKDILAMSISSVASESAFSTSGRILSDFRSSLSAESIQALVCAQDWIRKGDDPEPSEPDVLDFLAELEEGNLSSFFVHSFIFFILTCRIGRKYHFLGGRIMGSKNMFF